MTDPKLPPLPRDSWNGMYSEQQIQEHWLDGYRAGQSSAEALTEAGALARAFEIAAAPTPPAGEQWISVKERMPEHDVDVLVSLLSTAQVVAYFDSQPEKEGFVWQTMDGPAYRAEAVTHWMPLPTSPKGGQEP